MKKINRLINEISPYLRQHAENPVEWYPWCQEAFEEATAKDKPVFLSIGYSACHWCHVMAHECFEDSETAALMNDAFVCIKVDREELPHIDHTYMRICQIMTGSGGWPLSILMTPGKEPFFAATYIPKYTKRGLIGMLELIPMIKDLWGSKREMIQETSAKVSDALRTYGSAKKGKEPDSQLLKAVYESLSERFQEDAGGFSPAPKFPSPHHFLFLLRYHRQTGEARALSMVERTLDAMRTGGIYDHVGHGFHRYATDSLWRIPHFEKMLYDQALLTIAYLETYQVTKKELYRKTAGEILDYVLRDMRSEDGVFTSAEDADVGGEEGGFYLWTEKELLSLLGSEDYEILTRVFRIESQGNFPQAPHMGKNILFMKEDISADTAPGLAGEDPDTRIEKILKTLLAVRAERTAPNKDDKILTDWNGLMIAALAKAGIVLKEQRYIEAAQEAAGFILDNLKDPDGRLLHVYREGRSAQRALIDDYAFLVWGLIELYEASFKTYYLDEALALTRESIDLFWDRDNGGFFLTPSDGESVIVRLKEYMDNALPSGNSVMVYNLIRLARTVGDSSLEEMCMKGAGAFSSVISRIPAGATFLMIGLGYALGQSCEIVVAGKRDAEDTRALLEVISSRFLPEAIIVLTDGDSSTESLAVSQGKKPVEGKAAAYICKGLTCRSPITSPEELLKELEIRPKAIISN